MNNLKNDNLQLLETLIGVFTIDKGKIKILLVHKKTEPYKGYWVLPGSILSNKETLEDNITDVVCDKLGLPTLYIEQCYTFSNLNRNPDNRVIATSFIGLIDNITLVLKRQEKEDVELSWFDINSIPKMGYDHEKILNKLLDYFKKRIINSNILKILFPSDFTLPELQRLYEQITNKKLDRRNFRKHMFNLNVLEETGYKNETGNGRPAKLYRFKNEINQDSKVEE